jgi:transposase
MTPQEELVRLRYEAKKLRQQAARLEHSRNSHKSRSEKLEEKNGSLEKENQELREEVKDLQEKLAIAIETVSSYQGMIFKSNTHQPKTSDTKKPRGGQIGHKGQNRKIPETIDEEKRIFLSHCPDCHNTLKRSNATYERIIEDIPSSNVITTKYWIERQWCKLCQKEVCAIPKDSVSNFRFGQNIIGSTLFQKYRLRLPLNKIQEQLKECHQLKMSQGNIQNILEKAKEWFREEYDTILEHIRQAPVKHADETSWRVMGHNNWCWLFATPKAALYTIEESRGKGVPQKILTEQSGKVLVRDDYAGYKKLDMEHQSCWAHLLRKSKEASEHDDASDEIKKLHLELKVLFGKLVNTIEKPFQRDERNEKYQKFLKQIHIIQKRVYLASDAQKVQTRIRNQGKNLLTALLHEGVPLTNNHAEKQIRSMAVTRKISGGSQSVKGASIHAVNMSIVQTLSLQGRSVMDGLKQLVASQGKGFGIG